MRRASRWTAWILAPVVIGLQFTGPARTNPETDDALALERTESVPPGVARTLAAACGDCHSHRTRWPWYSFVAPASWWTVGHVNRGRAELNLSIWATYSTRMRATRLRAMCALVRSGEMPLRAYTMAHPEARVTEDQIQELCDWAARRLILAARSQ
jgi:hypothetical protein